MSGQFVSNSGFVALAISPGVVRRALRVALVVGTLLALINHVDALVAGSFAIKNFVQVLLSYVVPYAVSTYSAVHALRESIKKNQ